MLKLKNNIVPLRDLIISNQTKSFTGRDQDNGENPNFKPLTSFNGEYQIKITGLLEGANDQIAINAAIKDLHTANSLDRNQVSNGEVTFQELLDRIAALEKENNMHKGRLDTIRNVSRYDI